MSEPFFAIRNGRRRASVDSAPHAATPRLSDDGMTRQNGASVSTIPSQSLEVRREPRLVPPPESARARAFRELYDNLHLVTGHVPRRIMVAPPSPQETVGAIIDGLASHATACGHEVLTAALELDGERPVLRWRHRDIHGLELNLSPAKIPTPIEGWKFVRPRVDLVVIGGPPLTESIHAALLGRECDGMVMVVQPTLTRRAHVRLAVDRAHRAGCRLLGFVMVDEPIQRVRDGWLARLSAFYRARRQQYDL
jgi:Mrp family chromosome partitioning ATPase